MAFGEAEAAAILERQPTEVAAIVDQLRRLTSKPGENSFLVVSADDYYIQFLSLPRKRSLAVEAISNAFLSKKSQIGEAATQELLGLGFALPDPGFNFSMEYELQNDSDYTAVMTLAALFDIYRCPQGTKLAFELNLE
jgi:hypothetical protein